MFVFMTMLPSGVCMYVYVCVCMYGHMCDICCSNIVSIVVIYELSCLYVCMYVCMYIYMYICIYVCMYVYMYVCVCMYVSYNATVIRCSSLDCGRE